MPAVGLFVGNGWRGWFVLFRLLGWLGLFDVKRVVGVETTRTIFEVSAITVAADLDDAEFFEGVDDAHGNSLGLLMKIDYVIGTNGAQNEQVNLECQE